MSVDFTDVIRKGSYSPYSNMVSHGELNGRSLNLQVNYIPSPAYGHELTMIKRMRWIQMAEISFHLWVTGHTLRNRAKSLNIWKELWAATTPLHQESRLSSPITLGRCFRHAYLELVPGVDIWHAGEIILYLVLYLLELAQETL